MIRTILISFGLIYFWFGCLKFFPGLSPAEALAGETIHLMTLGLLSPKLSNILLAILECGLGICLMFNLGCSAVLRLMVLHLVCTFAPLVLMPEQVWVSFPFVLTLTGQYILKNLVLLSTGVYLVQKMNAEETASESRQPFRLRNLTSYVGSFF